MDLFCSAWKAEHTRGAVLQGVATILGLRLGIARMPANKHAGDPSIEMRQVRLRVI